MNNPADLDQLAAGDIDSEDLRILERVAAVYSQLDPVPAGLADRISFGITLDALHAEIAELQRSGDLVGVRAEAAPVGSQTVTFTSSDLTTMVTITPSGADRVRIDGWVDPGAGVEIELRLPGESMHAVVDPDAASSSPTCPAAWLSSGCAATPGRASGRCSPRRLSCSHAADTLSGGRG